MHHSDPKKADFDDEDSNLLDVSAIKKLRKKKSVKKQPESQGISVKSYRPQPNILQPSLQKPLTRGQLRSQSSGSVSNSLNRQSSSSSLEEESSSDVFEFMKKQISMKTNNSFTHRALAVQAVAH